MKSGHIVAVQDGDNKFQIHNDLGDKDVEKICGRFDDHMGERARRAHARIDAVVGEVIKDPDLVAEYFQFSQRQAERDALLNDDLARRSVDEAVSRVEQYHRYLDVGSAIIYRDTGFRGSPRFLSVTWPNLGWSPYCFNDKASSAVAWGGNILFEHSWYRGRRLYMIGVFRADDFNKFGFNDKASSYLGF